MIRTIILSIILLASINYMKSFKNFLTEMAPDSQTSINCDFDGICKKVIEDESAGNEKKILRVYKDSKGLPTLGHGHLINPNSKKVLGQVIADQKRIDNVLAGKEAITPDEAMGILKVDVKDRLPKLKKLVPSFETRSPELQANLYSEYHRGMLQQSPKAVKSLNQGDIEGFAKNYVDAKDYRESKASGTGIYKRMDRLVDAVKTEEARQKKLRQSSKPTTQVPQ